MSFNVVLTPDFKRELKQIAKKHRQVLKDLSVLIDELAVERFIYQRFI